MGGSVPLTLLLLGLPLVLLLVGGFLLGSAIFPRRRGDTRYCRKCNYNLTGSSGERCPECGANLAAPGAVVVGERRIRRIRLAVAIGVLLLGVLPLTFVAVRAAGLINWYQLRPTRWVVADLRAADLNLAAKAAGELHRRLKAGQLETEHVPPIAAFCLAEQAAQPLRAPVGIPAIELLGALYAAGALHEPDQTQFLEQLVHLTMDIRPQTAVGKPTELRFVIRGRAPQGGPYFLQRVPRVLVDGQPTGVSFSGWSGGGTLGSGAQWNEIVFDAPGSHEIIAEVELYACSSGTPGLSIGGAAGRAPATPIHTSMRTLRTTVEALDQPLAALVALSRSPKLDADVPLSLRPESFRVRPAGRGGVADRLRRLSGLSRRGASTLSGRIHVVRPPIDLAFDIVAVWDGGQQTIDGFTVPAGVQTAISFESELPVAVGAAVAVVLRPNRERAAATPDITAIWGGELRMTNLAAGAWSVTEPGAPGSAPARPIVEQNAFTLDPAVP